MKKERFTSLFNWSRRPDSNRQPSDYKSDALPIKAIPASTTLIKRPVVRLLAPLFIYRPPELRSHIVLSIGKSLWMIKIFRKYEMTVLLRLNYGNLGLSTSFKS